MARFLAVLLALALILVGVLAGGCSLLFTPELFRNSEFGGPDIIPVWAAGLIISVAGIWLGIWIIRRLGKEPTTSTPVGPYDDVKHTPPDDPPGGQT